MIDRKSTRLTPVTCQARMPSAARKKIAELPGLDHVFDNRAVAIKTGLIFAAADGYHVEIEVRRQASIHFLFLSRRPAPPALFPYTTLFRSRRGRGRLAADAAQRPSERVIGSGHHALLERDDRSEEHTSDSSHMSSSYAVCCSKKNSGTAGS